MESKKKNRGDAAPVAKLSSSKSKKKKKESSDEEDKDILVDSKTCKHNQGFEEYLDEVWTGRCSGSVETVYECILCEKRFTDLELEALQICPIKKEY
jgi:hypothetical protein